MRTLLLFDGLGGNNDHLLPALRKLHTRPENTAFFHTAFTALADVLTYIGPEVRAEVLPGGLPLEQWLTSANAIPPPGNSIIMGICVHMYQVCHLQPAGPGVRDATVAALGHSIGLQAAVVAGLRLRRMDEFLEVVASSLRLVAISLVRGHQFTTGPRPRVDLVDRYLAHRSRGGSPSPMASLTGMPRTELSSAVSQYNQGSQGPLSLGLVNSPTVHVLSGATADLLDFYLANETAFERSQATWAFLPNTIPFHSPYLAAAADRVDSDDRAFIGALPGPERLKLPVYATDAPRNLQQSSDLVGEYLAQVLVRPIEWELVARHAISDAAVERVVDYGPGPAARRFTRECLRTGAPTVRFESVQQLTRRAG